MVKETRTAQGRVNEGDNQECRATFAPTLFPGDHLAQK